jgi:hypothetical protein
MKRELSSNDTAATVPNRQLRCVCCDGEIQISPERDTSLGLNLALGLVSDECALVCDGCTSRLIAAREANKPVARGR